MDFFQAQDNARRNTGMLVFFFILAVIFIVLTIEAVLFFIFFYSEHKTTPVWEDVLYTVPWDVMGIAGAAVVAVILLGSLYKVSQLSQGGHVVAEWMGGRLLDSSTKDLQEKRLLNVVEEMAIASGTPVPPVYLIEDHTINAFAAGFSPGEAVIGVTRGTMETLTRDELQGVIAHEFSHIFNGDMRMNIRLMGVLHGILILAIGGYYMMRFSAYTRGRDNRVAAAVLGIGAVLAIVGFAGIFFGNLIKSMVSRQREYLADASAVQFTRNPQGIGGALIKIGSEDSRLSTAAAAEFSHAFFAVGVSGMMNFMFPTHPPLEKRIRRVLPNWDGKPLEQPKKFDQPVAQAKKPQTPGDKLEQVGVAVASVLATIGNPGRQHVEKASSLLESLPPEVMEACHEPYSARAVVYCFFLQPQVKQKQLQYLAQRADDGVYDAVVKLMPKVEPLGSRYRLPCIDICMPALKKLSPGQYELFQQNLDALIKMDDKVEIFEWALRKVLHKALDVHILAVKQNYYKYFPMKELSREISLILTVLAMFCRNEQQSAQQVFDKAAAAVEIPVTIIATKELSISEFDRAVERVAQVKPLKKRQLIEAALIAIRIDEQVTAAETELLRAICSVLDCPMPML